MNALLHSGEDFRDLFLIIGVLPEMNPLEG